MSSQYGTPSERLEQRL